MTLEYLHTSVFLQPSKEVAPWWFLAILVVLSITFSTVSFASSRENQLASKFGSHIAQIPLLDLLFYYTLYRLNFPRINVRSFYPISPDLRPCERDATYIVYAIFFGQILLFVAFFPIVLQINSVASLFINSQSIVGLWGARGIVIVTTASVFSLLGQSCGNILATIDGISTGIDEIKRYDEQRMRIQNNWRKISLSSLLITLSTVLVGIWIDSPQYLTIYLLISTVLLFLISIFLQKLIIESLGFDLGLYTSIQTRLDDWAHDSAESRKEG